VNITALILAAGASSRMGSPKALLTYKGETFLDRLIASCQQACGKVVVVLGNHSDAILAGIKHQPRFVQNPDPDRGQLSSLQCGLFGVEGPALFVPVDLAAIQSATIQQLVAAFQEANPLIAVPQFGGKHGHPVCVGQSVVKELLALPAGAQARDVIHNHRAETLYVEVDDPAILRDIDSRIDYSNLLAEATRP